MPLAPLRRLPPRPRPVFLVFLLGTLTWASAALAKDLPKRPAPVELPRWTPPPAYSVDMVMESDGKTFTMKRFIEGKKIRSEISTDGQEIVMIELGDEDGTSLMVMPEEKMAMKQSMKSMRALMPKSVQHDSGGAPTAGMMPSGTPPPGMEVEFLGEDKVNGVAARKYQIQSDDGAVLSWFDASSGAPLRMQSNIKGQNSTIEWKNLKVAPQPAKLYEIPKGYQVQDMDEMMKQMKSMKGMPGMGALMGGGAMGMAGGMASQAGSSFGASLGAGLGASFGGPIGAMAGQYIGGAVGGWVSRKVVGAVTPGK